MINISNGRPGRIIQTYLLLVRLLDLDVMEPLQFVKTELLEITETKIEQTSQVTSGCKKRSCDELELAKSPDFEPKQIKLSDENHECEIEEGLDKLLILRAWWPGR